MGNTTKKPSIPELKITAHPDVQKGVYSNLAIIHHTPNEFIIDFLMRIKAEEGQLVSRVILSPQHAKALSNALDENIKKFEDRFGSIKKDKYPNVH